MNNQRNKNMKLYVLNAQGTEWVEAQLNEVNISYKWIKLYNDDLSEKGIGMYKKPI
jgi:hypothetical protein